MDWFLPNVLYYGFVPILLYYCYCRLCNLSFIWYGAVVYALLSWGLSVCESMSYITGFLYILAEIVLLALTGLLLRRRKPAVAFAVASLIISVFCIIDGIMQSITYWIIAGLKPEYVIVLKYADIGRIVIMIILLTFIFQWIVNVFSDCMGETYQFTLPALVVPVLFITLVEKTVSAAIYGDTMIWDNAEGLIAPVVNNAELLMLRLLAFVGVFSTLIVYRRLTISIQNEQAMRLLEQQTQDQETYVREAKSRYEQTSSFRHDIKNHLLVLRQLLKEGKQQEAGQYLTNLELVSDSLSFPVHTGNAAVDVLLGSKLAMTKQQGIMINCSLRIPKINQVEDIDWCIILANGLDNAIKASSDVPLEERFIDISGRQKGNLYLLMIENRCGEKTVLPADGIGLSNIKAVAKKYGGECEIEISDRVFKLSILLFLSQQ